MDTDELSRGVQPRVTRLGHTAIAAEQARQCGKQGRQAAFAVWHVAIEQVGKQLQQPPVQFRRMTPGLGRQGKPLRLQPGHVDEQHQVRPCFPGNGVAGMHHAWVHQHRGTCCHLELPVTVQVGAAPAGDHTEGKAFMSARRNTPGAHPLPAGLRRRATRNRAKTLILRSSLAPLAAVMHPDTTQYAGETGRVFVPLRQYQS